MWLEDGEEDEDDDGKDELGEPGGTLPLEDDEDEEDEGKDCGFAENWCELVTMPV